ncbi:P-loop containing nucleoside triphosphate hydrolase protein [Lophium mytilinum]|uniref:RNA helicase n=1 Tax=Lophium mytilinum TaxID=390894 RepID=A0A6A6QPW0_9PEZI|nr:P-loop containing nucleoside triphosphate hydrolase protein [Lophium mytilinum]
MELKPWHIRQPLRIGAQLRSQPLFTILNSSVKFRLMEPLEKESPQNINERSGKGHMIRTKCPGCGKLKTEEERIEDGCLRAVTLEDGSKSFADLGLKDELLRGIEAFGLSEPSEIQQLAIPSLLQRDSMHIRHFSKSGKSLALAISALQLIDTTIPFFQVVILVAPHFKLEVLADEMQQLAAFMPDIKTLAISSPPNIRVVAEKMRAGPHHILIASPWKFRYFAETGGPMDSWEIQGLGMDFSKVKYVMFDDITEMAYSSVTGDERYRGFVKTIAENLNTDVNIVTTNCTTESEFEEALSAFRKCPRKVIAARATWYSETLPVYTLREEARRDHLMKGKSPGGYRFGNALPPDVKPEASNC